MPKGKIKNRETCEIKISVRIPVRLRDKLVSLACAQDITISKVIKQLIEDGEIYGSRADGR